MHENYNSIDVTTQLLLLDGMHTQKYFSPKLRQNAKQISISGAQEARSECPVFRGCRRLLLAPPLAYPNEHRPWQSHRAVFEQFRRGWFASLPGELITTGECRMAERMGR
jgi:hypothetical protein